VSRNRASAKKAGTAFETLVAGYLARQIDDRIERRSKNGNQDRGDISGLRHMGNRIVVECKNTTRWTPGVWLTEVEIERGNDDAIAGLVVAKRHGKAAAGSQVVLMSLADLAALLTGNWDQP
jgi:hypothetical protein